MTAKQFYHSDKWQKLITVLKQERVNEDGVIICEHCGLPIVRKYDCIGHHKIELTPENIEDVNISLNPDNIELIHFKCHNEIHKRFDGAKGQTIRRHVYLVYGSPCSGKSTWVNEVAEDGDLIIDVDRLWDALSKGGRYNKSNKLTSNIFGVRDNLIEQIKLRKGKWTSCYLIGGYPLRTDRDRLCEMLDAEPIFIDTSIDECLLRARAERPKDWDKFIRDWFDTFTP